MQRALSFFSCLSLSILLFTACGGGSSDNGGGKNGKDGGDKKSYKNMKKLDLSKKGVPAFIHVPKKNPDKDIRPAQVSPSNRGGVVISAGKVFNMRVMQAPPAQKMKAKKQDIRNMSGALKPKFIKENDSLLLYMKSVPGTDKKMFGFYMVKKVGGKPFIFESGKGEFSRANVDLMIKSANSLRSKNKKKAA
jgi:hypothetical protein